jgi:SNF2 family DNA or RNA helicase
MPTKSVDPSRWRTKPFSHQIDDARHLATKPFHGLFNQMGTGKSKVGVDATFELLLANDIDTVVIMCPAQAKVVWLSKKFGQYLLHAWGRYRLSEYSTYKVRLPTPHPSEPYLEILVVSYEFLRRKTRLYPLLAWLKGRKTYVIADESSYIKSHKAEQTIAAMYVRKFCKGATILNGTPHGGNLLDLYSQLEFLSPSILQVRSFFSFRAKIAVMGEFGDKKKFKKVIGWKNKEWLHNQMRPHVSRRLKADCQDLPPKLYTQVEVPLSEATWRKYKEMCDQWVAWVSDDRHVVAQQAIVKLMRLRQIVNGFISGVTGDPDDPENTVEFSREKLDWLHTWAAQQVDDDPAFRAVVWCAFRREQERAASSFADSGFGYRVFRIHGGQAAASRAAATDEFRLGELRDKPAFLFGQPQAGGLAIDLTSASFVVRMSNDYNLIIHEQAEDRSHRQGQKNPVLYTDVLAVGPQGQRTVDHIIYQALQDKKSLASYTTEELRRLLSTDEVDSVF